MRSGQRVGPPGQAPTKSGVRPATPLRGWALPRPFLQTLLTNVLAVVVAIASLFNVDLQTNQLAALIPSVAVLAAAIASGFYSRSRAAVKTAAITAPLPDPTAAGNRPTPVTE